MRGPLSAGISEIRGVFLFERRRQGEAFVAASPPGHLLHLVVSGEVRQRCNDWEYHLRPGDLLWYHENEFVEGMCEKSPWRFYSVVFDAPQMPPPDYGRRLVKPPRVALALFQELHRAWEDEVENPLRRSLRCHAALARLLLLHKTPKARPPRISSDKWLSRIWWEVENQIRQDLRSPCTLQSLAQRARTSPSTLYRAALVAVGEPPARRIKELKMEMARGLLIYSQLSISQIAEKVGYARVNEFSRDTRKFFGLSPSAIRCHGR